MLVMFSFLIRVLGTQAMKIHQATCLCELFLFLYVSIKSLKTNQSLIGDVPGPSGGHP